jgi:hypothetical protein
VRQPGQPAPEIKDQDKVPKDFKDAVLEKAKDYLRSEIQRRAGAPAGIPEIHEANLPQRPAISGYALRLEPLVNGRQD